MQAVKSSKSHSITRRNLRIDDKIFEKETECWNLSIPENGKRGRLDACLITTHELVATRVTNKVTLQTLTLEMVG